MNFQVIFFCNLFYSYFNFEIEESSCEKKYIRKHTCITFTVDSPKCTYGLLQDCGTRKVLYNHVCPTWVCKVMLSCFIKLKRIFNKLNKFFQIKEQSQEVVVNRNNLNSNYETGYETEGETRHYIPNQTTKVNL